jgi:hypothetical protein
MSAVCRDTGEASAFLQRPVGGGDGLPQLEGLPVVHGDARPLHEELAQELGARGSRRRRRSGPCRRPRPRTDARGPGGRDGPGAWPASRVVVNGPWPARAGRTATRLRAARATTAHRGRHGLDLPAHREHEHELAFVQHVHDLALGAHPEDARARDEKVGGQGVAAPGIEAAQGLHRLLDLRQPEARPRAGARPRGAGRGRRTSSAGPSRTRRRARATGSGTRGGPSSRAGAGRGG